MKKILFVIVLLSLMTGCDSNNEILEDDDNSYHVNEDIPVEDIDVYADNNPIKVGLYENDKLITKYSTTLANHKEITVFNIYYTNKELLDSTNIKYNFNKYFNEYTNIDNYKIGFYVEFEVDGEKIEKMVFDPTSKHSMTPYLYIYLYDDIHQENEAWYSHLELDDVNEDTIYSSIKLYLAQEGSKITSPISLTVFTYDSDDDFDENGYYRGNSRYTLVIEVK